MGKRPRDYTQQILNVIGKELDKIPEEDQIYREIIIKHLANALMKRTKEK